MVAAHPPIRLVGLDVIRGLALLLVLGRHMPAWGNQYYLSDTSFILLAGWNRVGWVGLDLFFVLSGYLIAGLLFQQYQREKTIHVFRFYVRRELKIYPSFAVFILIAYGIESILTGPPDSVHLATELVFLQNYFGGIWGHTWSLAVEEHFYLVLPLVLLSVRSPSGRTIRSAFGMIRFIAVGLAVLCLAGRAFYVYEWKIPYMRVYELSHLRFDSLFAGVFLRWLDESGRLRFAAGRRGRILACMAATAAVGVVAAFPLHKYRFAVVVEPTILYAAFALVVAAARHFEFPSNAALRSLSWIGRYSYCIYLTHAAVSRFASVGLDQTHTRVPMEAVAPAYIAVSVLTGYALTQLVELPMLRWRDRRYPSVVGARVAGVPERS